LVSLIGCHVAAHRVNNPPGTFATPANSVHPPEGAAAELEKIVAKAQEKGFEGDMLSDLAGRQQNHARRES
jgi:hypothetical protein